MSAAISERKKTSPIGKAATGRHRIPPSDHSRAVATPLGATKRRQSKSGLASSVRLPASATAPPQVKMSQLLRELLASTEGAKTISLERVFGIIGNVQTGHSLMLLSMPAMLPVSGTSDFVGLPSAALAGQMMLSKNDVKLPAFLMERSVSRKSLAVVIRAILPALEVLEKVTRPRWRWMNNFAVQRILGMFVFILALALAFPVLGFTAPHAAAIFMISLGMVEQDGLAVMIGVVTGIASLVLMTGLGLAGKTIQSKAGSWVKRSMTFLARTWATKFLEKRSLRRASLLKVKWADLLLLLPEAGPVRIASVPAKRIKPRKMTASAY
jgi:hypothetical protein